MILFMQAKHLSLSQRPEFVLHWPLKHTIALNTCIQYRKCLLACLLWKNDYKFDVMCSLYFNRVP